MRRRSISMNTMCVCLLIASMLAGKENDNPNRPQRFRNLFEVKQTVLLKTSSASPLYTIQLLSDEQTKQLEQLNAKRGEMEQRISSVEKSLEEDQGLETLAALLKERQEIQSRQTRSVYSQRMIGTPHVVTHVGEDYVALISGDTERFVPFRSLRYIYRSESLESSGRFPFDRGRSSQRDSSSAAQMTTIQLRHAKATELAEVIKKLYPEIGLKITADRDGNTLKLESQNAELRPVQQLIESLDAKVDAHARAEGRRGG